MQENRTSSPPPPPFGQIALIGLGLIGSSLGHAIKAQGLAQRTTGHAQSAHSREKSRHLGFVDEVFAHARDAVENADLVMLCTPLSAYRSILADIAPALRPGTTVSDAGSCKEAVARDFADLLPEGVHGIPGHPVAGTENSGPDAGFADLFANRFCILTPPPDVDKGALRALSDLWQRVGCRVEVMDPMHHDRVLAITSHLPHLIAYTIVGTAADLEMQLKREAVSGEALVETRDVIKYSAGGFRDFTRIAGSNPVMWRDIFLQNREPVLEMLGRFTEDLMALQRAVRWGDGAQLEDWFTRTRSIRRGILELGQAGTFRATEESESPPDGTGAEDANQATGPQSVSRKRH